MQEQLMTEFCALCGVPHCERHPEFCEQVAEEYQTPRFEVLDDDEPEDDPSGPEDS
jgi:hypothetical protein